MRVSVEAMHESGLRATLAGELTLESAGELHAFLSAKLAETDRLVLDLEAVTAADLTAAQLLIAAHRKAQALGKRFELVGRATPVVHRLCEAAGLLGAGLPEAALWRGLAA
jgi:anti-anti-sigma factor